MIRSVTALWLLSAGSVASAETLWTFSDGPIGFSTPSWDRTATFVLSDGNRLLPPFLFEQSLVTLDSAGQEIVLVADSQSDPDFDYFAQLLSNGIDDRLNFEFKWNGTSSGAFLSTFESNWFSGSPFTNGIDFVGAQITAIELRIHDISDGAPALPNGLVLSYTVSIEGVPAPDSDGDGVADVYDNCQLHANPSQSDADEDGFGTRCDADFNNDCVVNLLDLSLFKMGFFGADPVYDLDESGIVNISDLGLLGQLFFMPPGPSGLPNVCTP